MQAKRIFCNVKHNHNNQIHCNPSMKRWHYFLETLDTDLNVLRSSYDRVSINLA